MNTSPPLLPNTQGVRVLQLTSWPNGKVIVPTYELTFWNNIFFYENWNAFLHNTCLLRVELNSSAEWTGRPWHQLCRCAILNSVFSFPWKLLNSWSVGQTEPKVWGNWRIGLLTCINFAAYAAWNRMKIQQSKEAAVGYYSKIVTGDWEKKWNLQLSHLRTEKRNEISWFRINQQRCSVRENTCGNMNFNRCDDVSLSSIERYFCNRY